MRLWSIHPKYLDCKGLVALWREGLLAQAVLANTTKGYKHHPQLERFKTQRNSLLAIGSYLHYVHRESVRRGYDFDGSKILRKSKNTSVMIVSRGQLKFEWDHLRRKLQKRDPAYLQGLGSVARPKPHPNFRIIAGDVADWERIYEFSKN